jgi:hypothetical protein
MAMWNFGAMGQAGLTGWTAEPARPIATSIARRTAPSESCPVPGEDTPGGRRCQTLI